MPALLPILLAPPPRHRCLLYLQGILSDVARKNGWQLAEQAGESRPDGMQRLLTTAVWDENGVRDELRTYVLAHLRDPYAVVAIDETSFPKRGNQSAGVARQYCGSTKQVENCQVGVFLSYISSLGHTLLDRELYLPRHWLEDRARCEKVGIPEAVSFQTKCELARAMMERVDQAQIPVAWVVADTVYGNNLDLRTWLEDHQYWFALAVASTEQIGMMTPEGRTLLTVAQAAQRFLNEQEWRRFSVKTGTKGPLLFEWACLPILHRWEDDGQHWLLIRRIPTHPTDKTYYLVFGPVGTELSVMAWAVGSRWCIEEEFENAKDLGLDQYEVRSLVGWFRHVTLVLLVLAVVTVLCAQERGGPPVSADEGSHEVTLSPIPLTVPEVRRLLGRLLFPLPRSAMAVLARELVAPMPAGEGTRLSRKTAPELELVVRSLSPFSRPEGLLTASRAWLATSASSSFWGGGSLLSLHSPWKCPCSPCCPCNAGWWCLTPDELPRAGGGLMTAIPQIECCTMLGIDPKTLRNWLRHAHLHFVAHPSDARLKCLTPEQVQQLATLHARPIAPPAAASPALRQEATPLPSTLSSPCLTQQNETPLADAPPSFSEEAGLRAVVCGLEAKVMALQEQLAQLTLELLRERSERYERRLSSLEALLSQGASLLPAKTEEVPVVDHYKERPSQRSLQPGELRARSRVIPRVEIGAAGSYVLICPHEGELAFPTDSLEWFEWLCSLSSFRFIGHSGRFTAYREGLRSWRAYRTFHGRSHKQSLGTTDRLTIARLEQVAGMLQSRLT